MIGYVIWQELCYRHEHVLQGYWQNKTYNVHGETFGCFDEDVHNAKIYKRRKDAEKAMERIDKLANAAHYRCSIFEIDTETMEVKKPLSATKYISNYVNYLGNYDINEPEVKEDYENMLNVKSELERLSKLDNLMNKIKLERDKVLERINSNEGSFGDVVELSVYEHILNDWL